MSELKQFKLPDVGEGLTEADIVKWHVQPGDKVIINQIIVEIETAKAVVELPSPYEGVVASLLVAEGTTADVGTPIISVQVGDGPVTGPTAASAAGAAGVISPAPAEGAVEPGIHGSPAPKAERQAVLVGYGVKLGATTRRARKAATATASDGHAGTSATTRPTASGLTAAGTTAPGLTAPDLTAPGTTAPGLTAPGLTAAGTTAPGLTAAGTTAPAVASPGMTAPPAAPAVARRASPPPAVDGLSAAQGRTAEAATAPRSAVLAKPPVRKLAKDLGVDLVGLTGTGPSGSVTREDVQAAAAGMGDSLAVGAVPAGRDLVRLRTERIPIRGVRKHTAAAVVASAFTAPHVTEFLQIDMTETMAATARLKELPEFDGLRVSPLLLVAKALLIAVARHPMINSSWDEAAQEIEIRHYVNLGIAASTSRGLMVPNVKDAQAHTLPMLARAIGELADTARAGKSTPADLRDGTITITNVGIFGVDAGTPIITPGEAAILAFGQVKDAPWVYDGQLAVRQVCTLSLSFDHRIIDGDLGSAALRDVGAMLTDPLRILAWS
jgi:pyruvate dehydrogenase E2 component (dihydrolipoamide acetyltransferase)